VSENDPSAPVSKAVSVVGDLIKAAGESEEGKAAAKNIGRTAVTITKAINNALLPLAAVNFAFDKARQYFSGRFQEEISERTTHIPPEDLVEPKPSIAGPTLQGLAFTHEEPDLKELYLRLLCTAMDRRKSDTAHPAFVEIIKQLDAEDAALIKGALRSAEPIPIVRLHVIREGVDGYTIRANNILNLRSGDEVDAIPVENPRLAALIDNWCRLGLIEVDYSLHLTNAEAYEWAESRPETKTLRTTVDQIGAKVEVQNGILVRTNLGLRFALAVGLLESA